MVFWNGFKSPAHLVMGSRILILQITFAPNPAPIALLTTGGPGAENGINGYFNLSDAGVYHVMLTMELDNTGNEDAFCESRIDEQQPNSCSR